MRIKARFTRFVSSDPGIMEQGGGRQPVVVIAFGGEEGPVTELAIPANDARDLVASLLSDLVAHGDETARAIAEHFLTDTGNDNGEDPDA